MSRLLGILIICGGLLIAQMPLSNRVSQAVTVPPGATATIPFTADPLPDGGDLFDVACQYPGAVVSLLLPNGTEISPANAESQGIVYSVLGSSTALPGMFAVSGTHTLITLGAGSLPGAYEVRVNSAGATAEFVVVATYQSSSAVRAGVAAGDQTVQVGRSAVFTGLVIDGTNRLMDATVELALVPEDAGMTIAKLPLIADIFADQGAVGMYGAEWLPDAIGRYTAVLTASGVSPAGVPYLRQATSSVRVIPALAQLTSISDAAVDDTGDGILEHLDVNVGLDVTTAGRYRVAASLVSTSGKTVTSQRSLTLKSGSQVVALPFQPSTLALLGEDGPYSRSNIAVVYEDDTEPPLADRRLKGGDSGGYALAMFAPAGSDAFVLPATRLSFGPVAVNTSKDLALRIANRTPAPITQGRAKPSDSAFSVASPAVPFTVPAGGELELTVRFSPTSTSGRSGALVLGGKTVYLDGVGAAAAPSMRLAPTSLDFGTVPLNQGKDLTFVIRNLGGKVLTVSSVTSNATQFTLPALTAPFTVEPGALRSVTVRFSPTAAGSRSGTTTVKGDDPSTASATVSLSGKS
ncbi:choice-of-anchor D domain-containing protein [Paludibaculum fermentans]|uniref:choice-of-anchor D domain-containing protein n=1 Tax=Paludibaculum fermentans TaxID=1473598 RepID=UPI003EBA2A7B